MAASDGAAAAAAAAADEQHGVKRARPANDLCVVCQDDDCSTLASPCGHKCCCAGCARIMTRRSSPCPMCRAKVKAWVRVIEAGVAADDPATKAELDERVAAYRSGGGGGGGGGGLVVSGRGVSWTDGIGTWTSVDGVYGLAVPPDTFTASGAMPLSALSRNANVDGLVIEGLSEAELILNGLLAARPLEAIFTGGGGGVIDDAGMQRMLSPPGFQAPAAGAGGGGGGGGGGGAAAAPRPRTLPASFGGGGGGGDPIAAMQAWLSPAAVPSPQERRQAREQRQRVTEERLRGNNWLYDRHYGNEECYAAHRLAVLPDDRSDSAALSDYIDRHNCKPRTERRNSYARIRAMNANEFLAHLKTSDRASRAQLAHRGSGPAPGDFIDLT